MLLHEIPGGCNQFTPTSWEIPKVIGCVSPIRHTFLVPKQIRSLGIPSMESNPQYFPPKLKHLFARLSNSLHFLQAQTCTSSHTHACVYTRLSSPTRADIPSHYTLTYPHNILVHTDALVHTKSCVCLFMFPCAYIHTHINTHVHRCTTQPLSKTASEQGLILLTGHEFLGAYLLEEPRLDTSKCLSCLF